MQYTDDILANVQSILSTGMDSFESAQNTMMTSLNSSLNVVVESRKELGGAEDEESVEDDEDDNLSCRFIIALNYEEAQKYQCTFAFL
ncbi:MAG: hypothetical protein ACLUR5_15900 [Eubacterium ventriosum]